MISDPATDTGLTPIFSPRSVAVVGASRDEASIGYAILHNLITDGFQGPVFPVNPQAAFVHSLRCYPSVGAIGEEVDLAVVVVPKAAVLAVVEECLAAGVGGVVVISAGFGETGAEGAALEARLRDAVRRAGARMIGPNCMGVINTDLGVRLNATFAPVPAGRGSIGFVSQSGALGVAILLVASRLGIGLTQFASVGNKADVSGNDLLEYWENDDQTRVIAMYLESFGNPRHFTEVAKRVSRKKPILMVKSGRTAAGARAASSHTGALAGLDVTVSAFLDQCGVVRAGTIEELFDLALAFDRCPLPAGRRVAVVTNAGGPAIMMTDACINLGLQMAELGESTRDALRGFLPAAASVGNPVDMIASATPEGYGRAMRAVLADDSVDAAVAIHVTPLLANPLEVLNQVAAAARETSTKPVLAVMMASEEVYDEVRSRRDLPPVYRFPESAALALAQMARYAERRRRPIEEAVPRFAVDDALVSELVARTGEGYLPPEDAIRVLEAYGVPTVAWETVRTVEEALAAAGRLGYPVVAKTITPGLVHKSDVGAVAVDLRTPEELRKALEGMAGRAIAAGHPPGGFLIQRLAQGGHEVIFGLSTDPRFGPLLMFGLGGKYVEVLGDVRFAVTPLSRPEALEVIRGIGAFRLLEGVRGEAAADVDLLTEILLRLAQLTERHPQIVELDVNPFLAAPTGSAALDVRIRVAPPSA